MSSKDDCLIERVREFKYKLAGVVTSLPHSS